MENLLNGTLGFLYVLVFITVPVFFIIFLILFLLASPDKEKTQKYKNYLKFTCAAPFILLGINIIISFFISLFSN